MGNLSEEKLAEMKFQLESLSDDSEQKVNLLNDYAFEIADLDIQKATELSYQAYDIAKRLNYERGIAYAQRNLGFMAYYVEGDFAKAEDYIFKALRWFEENDDQLGIALISQGLGIAHWGLGEYERGFEYVQKAKEIFHDAGDKQGEAWSLNILGVFYYDWEQYNEALDHYRSALEKFRELDFIVGIARSLNGIANVYLKKKDYEHAKKHHLESIALFESAGQRLGISRVLNDLGNMYRDKQEYDKALEKYKQSLEIRQEIQYKHGESTTWLDLGELYLLTGKFDESEEAFHNALKLAQKTGSKPKICKAHLGLSQVYSKKGDFEKALENHMKYHSLEDEIYHEDMEKKLSNLKAVLSLEAAQKEAETFKTKNEELNRTNEELRQTLEQLHAAQSQLIQSGKMAVLGQLIAGILHEINTPAASVNSSLDVIQRAMRKIRDELQEISASEEKKDLPDLEPLWNMAEVNLQNTSDANRRIIDLMKNLQTFSRVDEASFQKTDLHICIDTTLSLLKGQLPETISVRKEYGNIPGIYCYPGELNQVFMNLITNSVAAMKDTGIITITTKQNEDFIIAEFADNGDGIAPDKLEKIFEPGFVMRDLKIRMSTGLYTSFNIIQKHNGQMDVKSEIGKGSVFTITLPKRL